MLPQRERAVVYDTHAAGLNVYGVTIANENIEEKRTIGFNVFASSMEEALTIVNHVLSTVHANSGFTVIKTIVPVMGYMYVG